MAIREAGTLIVAAYAAIVSTVALLWNILRDRQDSGRLRLSCSIACSHKEADGKKVITSYFIGQMVVPPLSDDDRHFVIQVTNIGKRPVTVDSWFLLSKPASPFRYRSATKIVPPQILSESGSMTIKIRDFDELRTGIDALGVLDTHGRAWNLPGAEFLRMKELMLEYHL